MGTEKQFPDQIRRYVKDRFGKLGVVLDSEDLPASGIKALGKSRCYRVDFKRAGGTQRFLIRRVPNDERDSDDFSNASASLIWSYSAFNRLPHHSQALDLVAVLRNGRWISLKGLREFVLLQEFVDGKPYYMDLEEILAGRPLTEQDRDRARALASYLTDIHSVRSGEAGLYQRRVRDLLGAEDGLLGVVDSYLPLVGNVFLGRLRAIERQMLDWRWHLLSHCSRLCQMHGDFHPWNILFTGSKEFAVIDRSRGRWGDAAEDIGALSINFIFYSLRKYGDFREEWQELLELFFDTYLATTSDRQVLEVIQPFLAMRACVLASPHWYPEIEEPVRMGMLGFAANILEVPEFDYRRINEYLRG